MSLTDTLPFLSCSLSSDVRLYDTYILYSSLLVNNSTINVNAAVELKHFNFEHLICFYVFYFIYFFCFVCYFNKE